MRLNSGKNLATAVAFLVGSATLVQAAPSINGSISFYGGATLNGPLESATGFTAFFGPTGGSQPFVLAGSETGNYASVPDNTPTTFTAFTFNPAPPSVSPLWTFSVGPTVYSFDATSVVVAFQNSSFLDIEGTGIAHITGFADTAGTWSVTDTGLGGTPVFTFGAATTVVPEPSQLVVFLSAVAGFVFLFRAKAKRA